MSKKSDHTHKYKRVQLGRNRDYVVWKCQATDCAHYVPRELIVGRQCICWRCGNPFTMTQAVLDLTKPHCVDCTRTKPGSEKPQINIADLDLDALLEGLTDGDT